MSTVIDKAEEKIDLGRGFYDEMFPISLKLNTKTWSDEKYFAFCQEHKDLRFETSKDGNLIIMPPTGGETSDRNSEINFQLRGWAKKTNRE